jgi:membrane protein YqaA with SNARE-associated domain
MFDWLHDLALRLGQFIVTVPIYVAGPAMVLIGALDSSLLSLPEVNDYLVVARCYTHPRTVFFFPLFAATGSVLGCLLLYTIMQRGGLALLHRRFKLERVQKVERAYARFGVFALAVPALLPPPLPFKIFVATAGALQFPRRRFLLTILIARSVRYYTEGVLAVFYGDRVLHFLKENGLLIVSVVAGICLIALAVYLLTSKGRRAVKEG